MVEEPTTTQGGNPVPPVVDEQKTEPQVDYKKLYEEANAERTKFKTRVDELCKENKAYKDREVANMTEQQRQELARKEYEENVNKQLEELATLKKEKKYSDAGFTNDEIALIMANQGDANILAQIIDARVNKATELAKAQQLKNSTVLPSGAPPKAKGFNDYTYDELNALKASNPAEYKRIMEQ